MGPTKPRYDHYESNMFIDDPVSADLKRKKKVLNTKIGTEPRMTASSLEGNPGAAQYDPGHKPHLRNSALYTFGFRRYNSSTDCLKVNANSPP